ncbi:hypothetical protein [Paracoccus xiamenensis]|uniref:hypothetical protein n=1 Tax=Paracoccus xiamenensis TaxID=2714901 RepID=UPI00140B22B3|nr:hypothetical protein [Paracoccus xiamenensis]NHF73016.1 hypothetical protein [Paracoccus xiamenensis]
MSELHIPVMAPQGALLDHAARALSDLNTQIGGSWFDAARPGAEPGQWADRSAARRVAQAHMPQAPALFDDIDGRQALILSTGENCGYRVEKLLDSGIWSAALIWHPAPAAEETRSLLAARGEGKANYLYLHQDAALEVELRDNDGTASLRLPAMGDGWQAVMIARAGAQLRIWRPADDARAEGMVTGDLPAMADLLIGARSHRAGMPKTLGAGAIGGVLVWPGHDLLAADPTPAARSLRDAFANLCLWEL